MDKENQKIIEYIKQSLAQGKTREDIYKELLNTGWSVDEIQEAFLIINEEKEKDKVQKRSISTVLVVGVILVGIGILSFVAANWQEIPRFIKVSMIILTMLASYGGGWFFQEEREGRRSQRIAEALFLLGSIVYGIGIFLIAQIFNIEGDWTDGFTLWMIGVIAMGLAIDSFYQFYFAIIVGVVTALSYLPDISFLCFSPTGCHTYNLFSLPSVILLSIAAILTFLTAHIIRKRVPPEFKKL